MLERGGVTRIIRGNFNGRSAAANRDGALVGLDASSRLGYQLDESRRQLLRLERHADRVLRLIASRQG
jgi:hypothetical protein